MLKTKKREVKWSARSYNLLGNCKRLSLIAAYNCANYQKLHKKIYYKKVLVKNRKLQATLMNSAFFGEIFAEEIFCKRNYLRKQHWAESRKKCFALLEIAWRNYIKVLVTGECTRTVSTWASYWKLILAKRTLP